jgi:hypothetical protein
MIQTILIVLVAVVVLIVIIAVLALRYLRADDSDSFDDIPDEPRPARRPAEQDREMPPAKSARRPRQPEQLTEVWAAADGPARRPDARAPSGFRDRDTGARPAGPQRAASQAGPRREQLGSRPARAGARPDGPDSATSSWDSLSDVDYWAELAADKPEITPAAGGGSAARRQGSDPVSDIRPVAGRPATRGDADQLPVRKRHQPSRPAQPSRPVGAPSARMTDGGQTEQIDVRAARAASAPYNGDAAAPGLEVLGRHSQPRSASSQRSSGGQRPSSPRRAQSAQPAAEAQPTHQSRPPAPPASPFPAGNGHGRGRGRADDDPLTSPSFPAVDTTDSRSYRTRRSGGAGQPDTSGQHARPAAGQSATSHQFIEYSSAPRRATSQPDGYPVQSAPLQAGTPGLAAATAAGHESPAVHESPAAPAANPYGSYVSQPPPPAYSDAPRRQNGSSSAAYSETPAPSLAAAAYSGHAVGQHAASADWYAAASAIAPGSPQMAAQPLGQPADGYLPVAGMGGNGLNGSSHVRNGSPAGGYAGIDYSSLRYDDLEYPDAAEALPGYRSAGQHAAQYEQQGYGAADPRAGQDAYRGYPGYGAGGR